MLLSGGRLSNFCPVASIALDASQNPEATARVLASRLWPPRTEVKLIACIGPVLSEMQLVCGVLDEQAEAVMNSEWPVRRELQSADLLVSTEVTADFPATGVIEIARRWKADSVFVWAEKMSLFERVFCGNLVASIASRVECSVEVVRGPVRRVVEMSEFAAEARNKDSFLSQAKRRPEFSGYSISPRF